MTTHDYHDRLDVDRQAAGCDVCGDLDCDRHTCEQCGGTGVLDDDLRCESCRRWVL